jgi:hypothetical protein
MFGGDEIYKTLEENPKAIYYWGGLVVDGRIILKYILHKCCVKV